MTTKTSTPSLSLNIVDEKNGYALCDIWNDDAATQSEKRFYVVRIDRSRGQVYNAIPADGPDSGSWFARISADGVRYVANGRTYEMARRWFKKLSTEVSENDEI